jgi:hypothetical protein
VLKKLPSLVLVIALVTTLGGTSALAADSLSSGPGASQPELQPLSDDKATERSDNKNLRAGMLELVEAARAGKVAPRERSQIQPAKRNNLSKGTKIAIGVGIAVAVVAVILIAKSPALNDGQ